VDGSQGTHDSKSLKRVQHPSLRSPHILANGPRLKVNLLIKTRFRGHGGTVIVIPWVPVESWIQWQMQCRRSQKGSCSVSG